MRTEDTPRLAIVGTAGLSSADQLVTVTSVPGAAGEMNLTAGPKPLVLTLRVGPERTKSVTAAEAAWRQLAKTERKRVKKRGLKPSDVVKAVAASRYRR